MMYNLMTLSYRMEAMNIENRYVKSRRVHRDRRLGTTPKRDIGSERRTENDRRGHPDRRLAPWSWHSGSIDTIIGTSFRKTGGSGFGTWVG